MENRTRTTSAWRCLAILAAILTCTAMSWGFLVGPAESLEDLTRDADLVFKGTAISTKPTKDDGFKPYDGYSVYETRFQVISAIKGEVPGGKLAFRYYDRAPRPGIYLRSVEPQNYHFEAGRTYIVFAKASGTNGAFCQLWAKRNTSEHQGAVLCANNGPVASKEVKDVVWTELTAMLTSPAPADVLYAIRQLDEMTDVVMESLLGKLPDFSRQQVLAVIRPLLTHPDAKIARAAIGLIASRNPYLSAEEGRSWLATVGSAEVPGWNKAEHQVRNVGGELCWKDLVALADAKGTTETRAAAIRALGLVREPALREGIERWLADPAHAIRAAATVLLADFPGPETCERLTALAGDAAPEVRTAVAQAVGFSQQAEMAGVLQQLLADQDEKVRQAAARNLLSFSPKDEAIADDFRANLKSREFQSFFLVALARENPADYLSSLARLVEQGTDALVPLDGRVPASAAWDILFKYLQAQPAEEVRAGEFDRYLNSMEKVGNNSPVDLSDLYAFYLQRGMTERAKKFRDAAKKAVTYDLDYFFDMVDKNPAAYMRK